MDINSIVQSCRIILIFPMWQKAIAFAFVPVSIVMGFASASWIPTDELIESAISDIQTQETSLVRNKRIAQDLPKKKKEYAELENKLEEALNMLPKKSQIPELLKAVSSAGQESGLDIRTFRPNGEVAKQLYAEVPVFFQVRGTFEETMTFLKRVGSMPRIVNVRGVELQNSKGKINMQGQAVTYRFLNSTDAPKNKAGKSKPGKKK